MCYDGLPMVARPLLSHVAMDYRVQARLGAAWETARTFATFSEAEQSAMDLLSEGECVNGVRVQRMMGGRWVDVCSIEPRGIRGNLS